MASTLLVTAFGLWFKFVNNCWAIPFFYNNPLVPINSSHYAMSSQFLFDTSLVSLAVSVYSLGTKRRREGVDSYVERAFLISSALKKKNSVYDYITCKYVYFGWNCYIKDA